MKKNRGKKNQFKRIIAVLVSVLMLCAFAFSCFAAPDLARKGSLLLEMKKDGKVIPGGSVTLYHVGNLVLRDGKYVYEFTDDFSGCGLSLNDASYEQLASNLAQYAAQNNINGITKQIGSDGKVYFGNLDVGLYLVVQNEATDGYYPINPFLISIPLEEDGRYLYSVDASPKFEPATEPTTNPSSSPSDPTNPTSPTDPTSPSGSTNPSDPSTPTGPTSPNDTTSPDGSTNPGGGTTTPGGGTTVPGGGTTVPGGGTTSPDGTNPGGGSTKPGGWNPGGGTTKPGEHTTVPTLPVTGQLNWPVPMLAFAGLFLVVVGLILVSSKRKEYDED